MAAGPVGCAETEPDGTTARIISSAGSMYTQDDKGVAVVGSRLDNGDEIISTPQSVGVLLQREGEPMPNDFLVIAGSL